MKNVTWTEDERARISDRLCSVLKRSPYLTDMTALSEAQLVLPPGRQRVITKTFVTRNRRMLVEQRINAAAATMCGAEVAETRPESANPPPASTTLEQQLIATLEPLLERVVERVLGRMLNRGESAEPDAALARMNLRLRTALVEGAADRPRPRSGVLVCGLQPGQAQVIRMRFPTFDIQSYDSNEAKQKPVLRRRYVVMMTRFIDHSTEERYARLAGEVKILRCTGGVTELCNMLNDLAAAEAGNACA